MNMLTEAFPTTILVGGGSYPIYTDFRDWINFEEMIRDPDLDDITKVNSALGYLKEVPDNPLESLAEIITALNEFYSMSFLHWRKGKGGGSAKPIFSWVYDAPYVIGAFRSYYGLNILEVDYMHWWEFKALFDALPNECKLNERISYRATKLEKIKDKAERTRIRTIQNQIALPMRLTDEEIGGLFSGD